MENLLFIRDTMARSAPLTFISGRGAVVEGVMALAGACVGRLGTSVDWWLATWIVVAFLGCLTGFGTMAWKARRKQALLFRVTLKRFAMSLFPPIAAGVVLTAVFYERGLVELMPGTWLLLYGVGVMTGGAFSVRVVPLFGLCFVLLGVAALHPAVPMLSCILWELRVGDLFLAVGFGVFHILFGFIIALRYDG